MEWTTEIPKQDGIYWIYARITEETFVTAPTYANRCLEEPLLQEIATTLGTREMWTLGSEVQESIEDAEGKYFWWPEPIAAPTVPHPQKSHFHPACGVK